MIASNNIDKYFTYFSYITVILQDNLQDMVKAILSYRHCAITSTCLIS